MRLLALLSVNQLKSVWLLNKSYLADWQSFWKSHLAIASAALFLVAIALYNMASPYGVERISFKLIQGSKQNENHNSFSRERH
jgi:hypothetical protein